MTDPAPVDPWASWFPPGLDSDVAEGIADAYWDVNPHLAAALAWEAYAATLPSSPSVSAVSTGAQSVSFSPPRPGGEFGAALDRAAWHRSFCASTQSVELFLTPLPFPVSLIYPNYGDWGIGG